MPAISQAAHSESDIKYKSSGTYQPIMSNPVISTLISKRHVIWWVCPILRYSRPLPSDRSTCFLRLSRHSSLPIFAALVFEGLATPGWPCGQASRTEPWHCGPASWMDLWHCQPPERRTDSPPSGSNVQLCFPCNVNIISSNVFLSQVPQQHWEGAHLILASWHSRNNIVNSRTWGS